MWQIWNVEKAKPVKAGLRLRKALRYANILEGYFGEHYVVSPA